VLGNWTYNFGADALVIDNGTLKVTAAAVDASTVALPYFVLDRPFSSPPDAISYSFDVRVDTMPQGYGQLGILDLRATNATPAISHVAIFLRLTLGATELLQQVQWSDGHKTDATAATGPIVVGKWTRVAFSISTLPRRAPSSFRSTTTTA
jgi:hypothetical protein